MPDTTLDQRSLADEIYCAIIDAESEDTETPPADSSSSGWQSTEIVTS